jgi:hypothetical protein
MAKGATEGENLTPMKSCKVCGEDIRAAAQKCTHCDSFQDWRRNLTFGSTVLSLLVALVAVLTAAVPVIKSAITPTNSDLLFSYQGNTRALIGVLATNRGARPGSVQSFNMFTMLLIGDPNERQRWLPLILDSKDPIAAKVIEPGKSELLQFKYDAADERNEPFPVGDKLPTTCTLKLFSTDFNGRQDAPLIWQLCLTLEDFIIGANEQIAKNAQKGQATVK